MLVVVTTSGGEVLLLRRTQPARFWQSVTGSLGWGETPSAAARRELEEETGIQAGAGLRDLQRSLVFPILPAWRARYAPEARFNREHWFLVQLSGRRLIRLNPGEHNQYLWLSQPRAERLASSWTNRRAIRLAVALASH